MRASEQAGFSGPTCQPLSLKQHRRHQPGGLFREVLDVLMEDTGMTRKSTTRVSPERKDV